MNEQPRFSRLTEGGNQVVSIVLKNAQEGTLAHTNAKNRLNQDKVLNDSELRSTIAEVLSTKDEIDSELTEKLASRCADLSERYKLDPDQLSVVLDAIYYDLQDKPYA
jgi:hypothetical protein